MKSNVVIAVCLCIVFISFIIYPSANADDTNSEADKPEMNSQEILDLEYRKLEVSGELESKQFFVMRLKKISSDTGSRWGKYLRLELEELSKIETELENINSELTDLYEERLVNGYPAKLPTVCPLNDYFTISDKPIALTRLTRAITYRQWEKYYEFVKDDPSMIETLVFMARCKFLPQNIIADAVARSASPFNPFVEKSDGPNWNPPQRATALNVAAKWGNIEMAKEIIKRGRTEEKFKEYFDPSVNRYVGKYFYSVEERREGQYNYIPKTLAIPLIGLYQFNFSAAGGIYARSVPESAMWNCRVEFLKYFIDDFKDVLPGFDLKKALRAQFEDIEPFFVNEHKRVDRLFWSQVHTNEEGCTAGNWERKFAQMRTLLN